MVDITNINYFKESVLLLKGGNLSLIRIID